MMELIEVKENNELMEQQTQEITTALRGMGEMMASLAQMISMTNERLAAMERKISSLEKVTPSQASELTRLIRERAKTLAEEYGADGCVKDIGNAIRRAVKLEAGTSSFKAIARCDYQVVKMLINDWDDYGVIRTIKKKARENK